MRKITASSYFVRCSLIMYILSPLVSSFMASNSLKVYSFLWLRATAPGSDLDSSDPSETSNVYYSNSPGSYQGSRDEISCVDGRSCSADHLIRSAHSALAEEFSKIDWRTQRHLRRVLASFRRHRIGSAELNSGLDGYAHGDIGREAIDNVYADVMGAEAALVRSQIFSGTHAIACALFGALRPGDTLLAVSGAPYDTLEEVIGLRQSDDGSSGTLRDWGVAYQQVDLTPEGLFDIAAINAAISNDDTIAVLHVQRSCGYQWRPSLPIAEIGRLCDNVRALNKVRDASNQLVVFVDNCYGEFVEDLEPCAVGAHLVAGSLIKNPGGTLARTGGYVAGKTSLVREAANRLSAPGVKGGATLGQNKAILQGLFNAPATVGESLKGAMLLAEVLGGTFGLPCNPPSPLSTSRLATNTGADSSNNVRTDIIQAVKLGSESRLVRFCEAVQSHCPVDAHVRPTPGYTPGYGATEVIFADGSFVDGATAELSADGPLREPFILYAQGGTHVMHWALVLEAVLEDRALWPRN